MRASTHRTHTARIAAGMIGMLLIPVCVATAQTVPAWLGALGPVVAATVPATVPGTAPATAPATVPVAPPRALLQDQPRLDDVSLPANILLLDHHRELVMRMLQASSTFRRQCARIGQASPWLTVDLRDGNGMLTHGARAHSFITYQRDGMVLAQVYLNVEYRGATVELIGHEFEHVLEWLDGVVYANGDRGGQVRPTLTGAVETRRAIAVGQQVAREVRADRDGRTTAGSM